MDYFEKAKVLEWQFQPKSDWIIGKVYAVVHKTDGCFFSTYLGDGRWSAGWHSLNQAKHLGKSEYSHNKNNMLPFHVDTESLSTGGDWVINNDALLTFHPKIIIKKTPKRILNAA